MASVTAGQLADFLGRERILVAAALEEAQKLAGQIPVAGPYLTQLARRGLLTEFQAKLFQNNPKGLLLGPYVLLDLLGEGAMGKVYKARHREQNHVAALKTIRPENLNTTQTVKRFEREMHIAAQIQHPGIVRTLDSGQAGNTRYYAMEYVAGIDLARLVEDHGPLPIPLACAFAQHTALALQHLHERGMVHRDIKPQNLMACFRQGAAPGTSNLEDIETVKILDLGLAVFRPPESDGKTVLRLTRLGAVMGTPDFMAPEQTTDAHFVDIRADLYSLGCTLFYLLSAQPLYHAGSVKQKMFQHRELPPPDVTVHRPEVPPGLVPVLNKLLAKKPEDRFATPAEVAKALEPFAGGALRSVPRAQETLVPADGSRPRRQAQPTFIAGPDAGTETPIRTRRSPWLLAGIGAGVVALGVVLVLLFSGGGSGGDGEKKPSDPLVSTDGDRTNKEANKDAFPSALDKKGADKTGDASSGKDKKGSGGEIVKPADGKIRVILLDGHDSHDWRSTTPFLKKKLEETGRFQVEVSTRLNPSDKKGLPPGWDSVPFPPDLGEYDVVLNHYNGSLWPKEFKDELAALVGEGKLGMVVLHAANNAWASWKEFNQMIGLGYRNDPKFGDRLAYDDKGKPIRVPAGEGGKSSHGGIHPFTVALRDRDHPITRGMPAEWLHAPDELYHTLRGPLENVHILATAFSTKTREHEPMVWTVRYGKGRVFHTPMGHDLTSMGCVGFLTTVFRGTEWAGTGEVTLPVPSDFPAVKLAAEPKDPPKPLPKGAAVALFNGKDLTGWKAKGGKVPWRVGHASLNPANPKGFLVKDSSPDGIPELIHEGAGGADIYTEAAWGDAVITLEVMVAKGTNSGIYVMGEYEIQILDSFGKAKVGPTDMGGIYGAGAPLVNASKPPGEWQEFIIDYQAPRFEGGKKVSNMKFLKITLNGTVIHEDLEVKAPTAQGLKGKEAPTGPLLVQYHGGPVAFRNIRVIPREAMPMPASMDAEAGFVSLFNGKDFTGFQEITLARKAPGPFSVKEGMIQISGKDSGYLHTTRIYRNYILRFDWKFLTDGNSGLLVHIQEPHKVWPKSVEVQGLQKDHGRIFAVGGAKGSFVLDKDAQLKAIRTGEWNTTEVISQEGKLTARVNGIQVSTGESELKEGLIAWQSEGAPILIRNIHIMETGP